MKHLLLLLFLFHAFILNAQDVAGVYQIKSDTDEFSHIRKLTLNHDGTFEFYHYRFIANGIPKETRSYGKGTWTLENKVITFSAEASDLDSKYTLDFNNSKARFNTKSPRDKTNRVFADFIIFYKTDVVLAQRLKLFKYSTL
ncbi:hypothetical protein [Psychroserpens sp. Hel_I_66]|uniref:hypothetical protein n=1 Tax=Psychroserpens sp. Hel_I_66 TaxID=1250004 RepID=UPI00064870DA|nr:hypothetical protein [Psychroserpens sp. Hel_I_66]